MASGIYNIYKTGVMAGSFACVGASTKPIFVALLNNSYTFNADHKYLGEFLGTYQVSGTAYVAGGHALSSPTVTQDKTDDEGVLDATDWQLGSSTITARFAILYSSYGGGSGSDPLICAIDFGSDQSSSNGNFTIQFAAEGIVNLT